MSTLAIAALNDRFRQAEGGTDPAGLSLSADHRRIEDFYPEAGEIIPVESEDAPYPGHVHRRDQARVVNLAPLHAVFDDKALPFRISRGGVRQQGENRFNLFDFDRRFGSRVS